MNDNNSVPKFNLIAYAFWTMFRDYYLFVSVYERNALKYFDRVSRTKVFVA